VKQNRFRSWALWTSTAALIVFCLKEFFGIDAAQPVNAFLDVLLPVVAAFGIVNDPTTRGKL